MASSNLQAQINRIKTEVLTEAGHLGKTAEEHFALKLAEAHINWQRVCAICIAVAFVAGAAMGWNLHA